ncbi:MAG: carbon-nitrogen hydrolase family protein [Rhizobiales bacterium PAR1]|nr:MAG: carbon-nitrogen hydrolase family protein [Rhizobiales bacterium PAR1]
MLTVAAITIGPAGNDIWPMLAQAEIAIVRAARAGATLIVLPELFALPYFASDAPSVWRQACEPLGGPVSHWAGDLARCLGLHIIFGMAISEKEGMPVNAAVLATPHGGLRVIAEKRRLPPRAPGDAFGEADHFRPGQGAPHVLTVDGINVVAMVCYDRRFPQTWQEAVSLGADLVVVLVAGPAPQDAPGAYEAELSQYSRVNALFVAAAARCGVEYGLGWSVRHDGSSLTMDCDGAIRDFAEPDAGAFALICITANALAHARGLRSERLEPSPISLHFPERKIL